MLQRFPLFRPVVLLLPIFVAGICTMRAATLTLQTNRLGGTPTLMAYNSGHFVPGSNTRDWWRYSCVSGARVFITANVIEPGDDIAGRGDGVSDQASFVSRRAALRANPFNASYINWSYLTNNYGSTGQHGSNILNVNEACSALRQLGIQILACITTSESTFVITNSADWPGKWELWQHFYAEAFYLGRYFDVQRYQMYNEPNLASGLTQAEFVERLQIVSDAVQSALADVNQLYGKSLTPQMFAPVSAGTASSTYSSWGKPVITNRHTDLLGQTSTNFWLIRKYDYHEYNSAPSSFGANLASLNSLMTSDMFPEARFPTSISEFNVHTAGTYDTLTNTLDTPFDYTRFGSIVANLAKNFCDELYCFKFSQTLNSTTVKKNGMHFVDNTNAPYNIGGVTGAGEVWRLFNIAAAPGRDRLGVTMGTGTSGLDVTATYDPVTASYYLFTANPSTNVNLTVDVSICNAPVGQRFLLQEVSETCRGGGKLLGTVAANQLAPGVQPSNTVWMFTIPTRTQEPLQTIVASADAMVQDGANRYSNFGANTTCIVRNNSTNTSLRSAALLKFQLPLVYPPDIQFALLAVRASSLNGSAPVQAHVYGLTNSNWSQNSLTWSNAPNLAQGVGPGSDYTNNIVLGAGDSAKLAGQLVADNTLADRYVDVTKFVRGVQGTNLSFLLAREVRFFGDVQDNDGLTITSREGDAINGPRLLLVRLKDTDGDGISDDAEVNVFGTNPNNQDTDSDGFRDGEEILLYGTDPGNAAPVAPTIGVQPVGQTVQVGGNASFSVSVSGTPPLTFKWLLNGTNTVPGATNAVLSLQNVQSSQAGLYSVLITNQAGSATSSNAQLTVTTPVPPPLPVYDGLDYVEGTDLANQGGWQLNGGTSATIESGSLNVGGLSVGIGNRLTWGSDSMSLRLPLGTNLTSGQLYFSFAMRVDSLGGSFVNVGTLAGFTTGTGTSFGTKVNIQPNGVGGFNLGTSKAGGTTFGGWASPNFNPGETIFVVGRYTFNAGNATDDTCDLWVNPGSDTFGAASAPVPSVIAVGAGGNDLAQIDRFFFRSGGSSSSPSKLVADEVRIGRTWAEVTPVAIPRIAVSLTGSSVTLSWPTNPPGFGLQSASLVAPSVMWGPVATDPSISSTNFVVTLPATNPPAIFRLRR